MHFIQSSYLSQTCRIVCHLLPVMVDVDGSKSWQNTEMEKGSALKEAQPGMEGQSMPCDWKNPHVGRHTGN